MLHDPNALLLYKLVLDLWEGEAIPYENRTGYNIGALIVDPQNKPVWFERNKVTPKTNATEHAELLAIRNYLTHTGLFDLKDHILYASLEPCIMCMGTMIMTNVKQVYFGQHDNKFGQAVERLNSNSTSINRNFLYPRAVSIEPAKTSFVQLLDDAHQKYVTETNDDVMARFLASDGARRVYELASKNVTQSFIPQK